MNALEQAVRGPGIEVHSVLHVGECGIPRDGLAELTVVVAARVRAPAGVDEVPCDGATAARHRGIGHWVASLGNTAPKGLHRAGARGQGSSCWSVLDRIPGHGEVPDEPGPQCWRGELGAPSECRTDP